MRARVRAALIIATVTICTVLAGVTPALAADCYGASCNGRNPEGTSCARDARSVMGMNVNGDGMLELRYSPSCKANWGRFSVYTRSNIFGARSVTGINHASIYAWNRGQQLYGLAAGSRWWTTMIDGTIEACTGVDLYAQDGGSPGGMYNGNRHLGWFGNLCG